MIIKLYKKTGTFAENKDVARELRESKIMPALKKGKEVILDFTDIEGATQSFVHALISEAFRVYGVELLDVIQFKSCNETVKEIINLVCDYMQESI